MYRTKLAAALALTLFSALAACSGNNDTAGHVGATAGSGGTGGIGIGDGVDCVNGPNHTNCPCTAGESVACYTGSAATRGIGACKDGVQTCTEKQELHFAFGPCVGETLPSAANGGCVDGAVTSSGAGGAGDGGAGGSPATRHGMVVFGGSNDQLQLLDETWIFDGSTWDQIVTPGPPARRAGMMATLGGKVVLFGGIGQSAQNLLNDTWTFDGSTWKQIATQGPPGRYWGLLTPVNGKLMLFGGIHGYTNTYYGDTWLFDGASWTQIMGAGPSARYAPIGGATLGGKVVLQGGIEFNGVQASDEWLFDGTAWMKISAAGPTFRSFSLNMTLGGQALIAGGDHAGDPSNHYSDTWSFDGASWAQRATSFGSFWDQIDISSAGECGAAITSGTVGVLGVNAAGVAVFDGTSWSHPNVPNPPAHRTDCAAGTL